MNEMAPYKKEFAMAEIKNMKKDNIFPPVGAASIKREHGKNGATISIIPPFPTWSPWEKPTAHKIGDASPNKQAPIEILTIEYDAQIIAIQPFINR